MDVYASTEGVFIATADCSTMNRYPGTGADLCNHYNLRGYPYLVSAIQIRFVNTLVAETTVPCWLCGAIFGSSCPHTLRLLSPHLLLFLCQHLPLFHCPQRQPLLSIAQMMPKKSGSQMVSNASGSLGLEDLSCQRQQSNTVTIFLQVIWDTIGPQLMAIIHV